MSTSSLKERLTAGLIDFAWREWAQMGVLAAPPPPDRWAQDPEALLLLTLEIGRDDPRLFDEVLDWLVVNQPLMSTRRLRTLCESAEDVRLSEAAVEWALGHQRKRAPKPGQQVANPEPLFRNSGWPVREPDPIFVSFGFLRPPAQRSGKSTRPDAAAPINFTFRLRSLLGVGTRAEAVRYLLTADVESASVADVTASSGFAKRNIQEALTALHSAGVASATTANGEQRYAIDRARWAQLLELEPDELPIYRDWPTLLGTLRRMLRWLARAELDDLSDYLRASQAADLLDEVRPALNRAGILLRARVGGERSWTDLEDAVDTALQSLVPQTPSPRAARFELVEDASGSHRWRLATPAGRVVATSPEGYASERSARAAIARLQSSAPRVDMTVSMDRGAFRWEATADNGRALATSSAEFADAEHAARAARQARELIATADSPEHLSNGASGREARR